MTPPPAESVAAMIRDTPAPPDSKVNRDLLRVMEGASPGYFFLLALSTLFVVAAGATWVYQVYAGLGIAGYAHPVFWGAYIVTFVFWVGIAHAGTLISAILFLFRAKWRNAINRSRGGDDRLRGAHGGPVPRHPRRPDVEVLLHPAVPESARALGELQEPAPVGHLRDHDVRDDLHRLLLRRSDPGHRHRPRPRHWRPQGDLHGAGSSGWQGTSKPVEVATTARCSTSRASRRRWCSRCTRSCPGTSRCRSCPAGTPRSSRPTSWPAPSSPASRWC